MDFADDPILHVIQETIYQSLFVQGATNCDARLLAACGMPPGRLR
jgi:hypothetical protein